MGNSTRTRVRSSGGRIQARCTCDWSTFSRHDELLRLESEGIDGICRLVADWALEGAGEGRGGTVSSSDFEAFVAAHDWSDPLRMYRLGRDLSETFDRYRRDGAGTRTAFENEVGVVRCKAATLRAYGDRASADELDHGLGEIVAWIEGRQATRP